MTERKTPAAPGAALAAYRAALARVEPSEAFLARTRQALAEAAEPAPRRRPFAGLPAPWRLRRLAPLAACLALALLAVPAAYWMLDGAGASGGGTPEAAYQMTDTADTAGGVGMVQSSAAMAEAPQADGECAPQEPAAPAGAPENNDAAPPARTPSEAGAPGAGGEAERKEDDGSAYGGGMAPGKAAGAVPPAYPPKHPHG